MSMDSEGPFSPSVKLMRPHTTLHRHHHNVLVSQCTAGIHSVQVSAVRSLARMFVDSRVPYNAVEQLQWDKPLL